MHRDAASNLDASLMKTKPPLDPPTLLAGHAVQPDKLNSERRRRRVANGRRAIQPTDAPLSVAKVHGGLRLPSTNDECIEHQYKDHVIRVERQRVGWRAAIYPKGSPFALSGGAYSPEAAGRDAVMEQAKAIIDSKSANERLSHSGGAAATVRRERFTLTPRALLGRLRRYLWAGWAAAKDIYFSVDQPRRRNSPRASVVPEKPETRPGENASVAVPRR